MGYVWNHCEMAILHEDGSWEKRHVIVRCSDDDDDPEIQARARRAALDTSSVAPVIGMFMLSYEYAVADEDTDLTVEIDDRVQILDGRVTLFVWMPPLTRTHTIDMARTISLAHAEPETVRQKARLEGLYQSDRLRARVG